MRLIYNKKELRAHMLEYVVQLKEMGLTEHEINNRIGKYYTNNIIRKYSPEQEDLYWKEIYHTIMEVPGGYWQIVDNMDYMPLFEHRRFKCLKSKFGQK